MCDACRDAWSDRPHVNCGDRGNHALNQERKSARSIQHRKAAVQADLIFERRLEKVPPVEDSSPTYASMNTHDAVKTARLTFGASSTTALTLQR